MSLPSVAGALKYWLNCFANVDLPQLSGPVIAINRVSFFFNANGLFSFWNNHYYQFGYSYQSIFIVKYIDIPQVDGFASVFDFCFGRGRRVGWV